MDMLSQIISIGTMPQGQERIEAECECVSNCFKTSNDGLGRIGRGSLIRWVQNKEASVFFSFHITPTHDWRAIADRVCDMLPLCSRDIWIIEMLLRNNPGVLFTPYPSRYSTKPVSYLDRAFNSCCRNQQLIGYLVDLDERIQGGKNISPETKEQYHEWIQSRTGNKSQAEG
ncbi:MAG: hypothetical protein LBJ75_03810 [Puniceicoccales bacterium]|jgi:hypothetical protein|nr:hypothetical protein [Puniceicoccales bacterium]